MDCREKVVFYIKLFLYSTDFANNFGLLPDQKKIISSFLYKFLPLFFN